MLIDAIRHVQRSIGALEVLALLLSGVSCLPALDAGKSSGQFSSQTWQTENGLPQDTVRGVVQTRDGFIWFATEDGLVRFDGFRFAVYDSRTTPAIKSNDIRSLLEDRTGRLWIATADGIAWRDGERFRYCPAKFDGLSSSVLSLHLDKRGGVWAITPNGLSRWDGERFRSFVLPEIFSKLTGAMTDDAGQGLWLGTQQGLILLKGDMFSKPGSALNSPTLPILALLRDASGRLWAGTSNGLFLREAGEQRPFLAWANAQKASVTALFEDREKTIWAGTDQGLFRIREARRASGWGSPALARDAVLAVTEDMEGNIWAGTESSGVTILRDPKFTTYTARDGLAGDTVRCVYSEPGGGTWVGTDRGLTRMEGNQLRQFDTSDGLSSNVILSLAGDGAGTVLAGTPDGLNRLSISSSGKKVAVVTSAEGLPDDFVRSIYYDRDHSIWLGTRRGLAHLEDKRITAYTQTDGLGSDLIGSILRGHDGVLWIATFNGLTEMRNQRFQTYRRADGLASNIITALHEDGRQNLWVGTQGGGLHIRLQGRMVALPKELGLPETIYGIVEDGVGGLWLSSPTGIVRAGADELIAVAEGRLTQAPVVGYGTSDGLRIAACGGGGHPGAARGSDGSLWFATLKGVSLLRAAEAHLNDLPPKVAVEAVLIDDLSFLPDQVSEIAPGHSRLAFEYAGLSFSAPQKVRYRYRLEPFDKSWIDGGARRTAFYTNLSPGRYRFEVMARNNDGIWSSRPADVSFLLEPRFYQTYWFSTLLLIALCLAAYAVYRWRVAEVEARFQAVLQERNRIAREIHDTLAQGFVGVSVQLEIVSRLLSNSVDAAQAQLDQARLLVRESISEARRSIWQLRSENAQDFPSRLSQTVTRSAGNTPVRLSFEVRGAYRPLGRKVEDELLRIGQEAVANAVRHSGASRLEVELSFDAKLLRMKVADNGRGFAVTPDLRSPDGHFGLRGMRERAEQIGARLTVESAPGKGTKVLVEAPVG